MTKYICNNCNKEYDDLDKLSVKIYRNTEGISNIKEIVLLRFCSLCCAYEYAKNKSKEKSVL